jgi:transmembrane sensor
MTEVPRKPTVADEAAQWLATLTDSACTRTERQTFVEWLRRSNLHVEEFLRISALTQRLGRPDLWPPEDLDQLTRRAIDDLSSPARPTELLARNVSLARAPPSWPRWRLAACAASALVVLALAVVRFDPFAWLTPTYATSVGELRSITLEDGSVVELNTQSRLQTHFTATERRVDLSRGEAVFRVTKNPARPFRVATGSAEIVAVGTAFNVYAQTSRTVITVLEGRVRVSDHPDSIRSSEQGAQTAAAGPASRGQTVELARGEQAIVAPDAPISRASLADPKQVTSWTERRLIFEETPLVSAAAEFARYNTKAIRIEDEKLGELHISGVFDATDPASLVQFVNAYGDVEVREDRLGWILGRKESRADSGGDPVNH